MAMQNPPESRSATVPPEAEAIVAAFRTCEFATLAKDGTPIVWPTVALWQPEHGRFVVTTSIGLPQKAKNALRDPRVSMLFSDPTGSGLDRPATVLVQGNAEVVDEVRASPAGFEDYWRMLFSRQPAGTVYSRNALTRRLMDQYYFRIYLLILPTRFRVLPRPEQAPATELVEVTDRTDQLGRHIGKFGSAVLNGRDGDGHPASVRGRVHQAGASRALRLELAAGGPVQPGPVSLLCHSHDERLWNLRSFLVRGTLQHRDGALTLTAERFIPGAGIGGPLGTLKMLRGMRTAAATYLAERGLARPQVAWDEYDALH